MSAEPHVSPAPMPVISTRAPSRRRAPKRPHLVEALGVGDRGDKQEEHAQTDGSGSHCYLPLFCKYSGPTRISRGLAPCPGPMMWSCSIMSMNRAALG